MANNKKGRRQKGKKKKPRSLKSWTENRKKHKAMGGKKIRNTGNGNMMKTGLMWGNRRTNKVRERHRLKYARND